MNSAGWLALLFTLVGIFLYFLPSAIAGSRRHPNSTSIFVLNLLLGWTFVGWVVAIVWAFSAISRSEPSDADNTRDCPYCAEPIQNQATKCKHCGSNIALAAVAPETALQKFYRSIGTENIAGLSTQTIVDDVGAPSRVNRLDHERTMLTWLVDNTPLTFAFRNDICEGVSFQ